MQKTDYLTSINSVDLISHVVRHRHDACDSYRLGAEPAQLWLLLSTIRSKYLACA